MPTPRKRRKTKIGLEHLRTRGRPWGKPATRGAFTLGLGVDFVGQISVVWPTINGD